MARQKEFVPWLLSATTGKTPVTVGSPPLNLYAEALPPNRQIPVVLYAFPGTRVFCSLPVFPVHHLHTMRESGRVFAIADHNLYELFSDGSRSQALGGMAPHVAAPYVTADNGDTLVICSNDGEGYAYSDANGFESLTTLDGWRASRAVTFQDGRFVFTALADGVFFYSDLYSVNLDPLNFASAEGSPDNLVRVISHDLQLWMFGAGSTEIWYNSGNPLFTFERLNNAFVSRGLLAPYSLAKHQSGLLWLADDRTICRTAGGYQPQRISTHDIEESFAAGDVENAIAFVYEDRGHDFYQITFPSLNLTWVHDLTTGLWFRREHHEHGRHHAGCHTYGFGLNLVGDFQNGNVYALDHGALTDHGGEIIRQIESFDIMMNQEWIRHGLLEVDMDAGVGLTSGQGSEPVAMLELSDDGGRTWRSAYHESIGKQGEYQWVIRWHRLGRSRRRRYRLTVSDPVTTAIRGAYR